LHIFKIKYFKEKKSKAAKIQMRKINIEKKHIALLKKEETYC